jgi:hypothetical protein
VVVYSQDEDYVGRLEEGKERKRRRLKGEEAGRRD